MWRPPCRFRHSICLLSGENGENEGMGSLPCSEELPELLAGGGRAGKSSYISSYTKQSDLFKRMRFLMTFVYFTFKRDTNHHANSLTYHSTLSCSSGSGERGLSGEV